MKKAGAVGFRMVARGASTEIVDLSGGGRTAIDDETTLLPHVEYKARSKKREEEFFYTFWSYRLAV